MQVNILLEKSILRAQIQEFLREKLKRALCSKVEVIETPLGTRVIIYAARPGLVIGKRGRNILELSKLLEERFGLFNVQITVMEVEDFNIDPVVIARNIASAIERGIHFRRVAFVALRRIMSSEKVSGAEIRISGKLRSQRARTETFREGIIYKVGDFAEERTVKGFATALLPKGVIGVKVFITLKKPEIIFKETKEEKPEEKEEATPQSS